MSRQVAITTIDNPYDPITDFENWYAYDEEKGYHSSSLVARLTYTSDEISEADQEVAFENAIDEIVKYNVSGMHKKVVSESNKN